MDSKTNRLFELKELESLKQKLCKLKTEIADVISQSQKKEKDYEEGKINYEKEIIQLEKMVGKQEYKIDNLDKDTADWEMKLGALDQELFQLETSSRDDNIELEKIRFESDEMRNKSQKTMASMRENLKQANEDLAKEEKLQVDLELSFDDAKKNMANETEEKIKKMRSYYKERYNSAEAKYKSKEEPLLYRIRCLDTEIEEIENEILAKPLEMQELERKYGVLMKKLQALAMRGVDTTIDCEKYTRAKKK